MEFVNSVFLEGTGSNDCVIPGRGQTCLSRPIGGVKF